MNHGTAKCVKEISLSIWDGSGDTIVILPDEVLDITYREYNGTVGLTNAGGTEFCVSPEELSSFLLDWEY